MSSVNAALVHGWWLRLRDALQQDVDRWNAGGRDGVRAIALHGANGEALAISTDRAKVALRLSADSITVIITSEYVPLPPTDAIWFTPNGNELMAWFRAESFAEPEAVAQHILALLLGSSHREHYG
jgi:hypothetical protein